VETLLKFTPDVKMAFLLTAKGLFILFPLKVEPVLFVKDRFPFSFIPISSSKELEPRLVALNDLELKPLNPLLADLNKPPLGLIEF